MAFYATALLLLVLTLGTARGYAPGASGAVLSAGSNSTCSLIAAAMGQGPGPWQLGGVLDGAMLGTKSENCLRLLGSDAGKIEKLGGVREIDSHFVPHGSLLGRECSHLP